jgi:hypothetical protein
MAASTADVDQRRPFLAERPVVGRAAQLTATIAAHPVDGDALQVKDAVIGAEGPSIVKANVANSAKIDALGVASVTLAGNPACTVKAQGSATVTGCKD